MKDIDPDRMLARGEMVGKSLWDTIRVWTIRLGVIFVPIYAVCFGARNPDPDRWPLDGLGTAVLFLGASWWGLAAFYLLLPLALRGTVELGQGHVTALTARGRRELLLDREAVVRRWLVPNPKGPMEVWWSVRSGHSWLLFPDQRSHSASWWSGPDVAVLDGPTSTAFLRGLGAFLLALVYCVTGLLVAVVLVSWPW